MRLLMLYVLCTLFLVCSYIQSAPPLDNGNVSLQVSIATGRREFHIGEAISLELSFSSSVPDAYTVQGRMPSRRYEIGLEEVTVSPGSGWEDPWTSYRTATTSEFMNGNGPNSFGLLSSKPFQITLRLNDYVRFTKPGRYAIRVNSTRVSPADAQRRSDPIIVTSNAIALDIVASPPE
jgi:hypothetical protein